MEKVISHPHSPSQHGVEAPNAGLKIRLRKKGYGSHRPNVLKCLFYRSSRFRNERHSDDGGAALLAGEAVDQNRLAAVVFVEQLCHDLGRPQLHIFQFYGLQVVIYRHSILTFYQGRKGQVFRAVEDAGDPLVLQKGRIHGSLFIP